jgi:HSP20 family protein
LTGEKKRGIPALPDGAGILSGIPAVSVIPYNTRNYKIFLKNHRTWHGLCLYIGVDGQEIREKPNAGGRRFQDACQGPRRCSAEQKHFTGDKEMKTLTLYRPFIENALRDFDRYMETFFGDSPLSPSDRVFNHVPACDVREAENAYIIEAELPGYDEKEIQVHVENGALTIESQKEELRDVNEKKDKKDGGNYLIRERRSKAFSRSFRLPENADPESVSAAFKNGILCLEVKKRAEAKKRLIQIKSN